ncbi:hypothetical protein IID22_01125 [Patescibacteria group bacterium]|nr:hypothetical protein [Patescibacteria group bacterium]
MAKKINFKVGDKIVDSGQVFRIFKIKKQKNDDGELERVVYFKPYYPNTKNSGVICSIPLKNIEKTEIRKPLSTDEVKRLFRKLKKRKKFEENTDINKTKELLKGNDPVTNVDLIRILWIEKKHNAEYFSKNKRDVYNLAIDRFAQEFALVKGLSLEKAKERVHLALQD